MRILVTVASRHGGTHGIACRIAGELAEDRHQVDVVEPQDIVTVRPYDAVVLGSAVYTGHWLPSARGFGEAFADDLRERPVWLFSSGLSTAPSAAANSPAETRGLAELVGARGHRSFAGRLDLSVLSRWERAVIAAARARQGDHRDMGAVSSWARTIGSSLAVDAPFAMA